MQERIHIIFLPWLLVATYFSSPTVSLHTVLFLVYQTVSLTLTCEATYTLLHPQPPLRFFYIAKLILVTPPNDTFTDP